MAAASTPIAGRSMPIDASMSARSADSISEISDSIVAHTVTVFTSAACTALAASD